MLNITQFPIFLNKEPVFSNFIVISSISNLSSLNIEYFTSAKYIRKLICEDDLMEYLKIKLDIFFDDRKCENSASILENLVENELIGISLQNSECVILITHFRNYPNMLKRCEFGIFEIMSNQNEDFFNNLVNSVDKKNQYFYELEKKNKQLMNNIENLGVYLKEITTTEENLLIKLEQEKKLKNMFELSIKPNAEYLYNKKAREHNERIIKIDFKIEKQKEDLNLEKEELKFLNNKLFSLSGKKEELENKLSDLKKIKEEKIRIHEINLLVNEKIIEKQKVKKNTIIKLEDKIKCQICNENLKKVIYLSCLHFVDCWDCLAKRKMQYDKKKARPNNRFICPICNSSEPSKIALINK